MNEIEIVFGINSMRYSIMLLRASEASKIIEYKEVEIATALGMGLLILILDKSGFHEKIDRQHDIIDEKE